MTDHPLVSTHWLNENISSPDVMIVNAWMPPVTSPEMTSCFEEQHIEGAVFFDINEICDKNTDLPHMLPPAHVFSSYMRRLGISNSQTIVVYDEFGFYSAPRVWWTLKVMGAEHVYVLDGGLPRWLEEHRPVSNMPSKRQPSHFMARLNNNSVADLPQMLRVIESKSHQVVDARSSARFSGDAEEPREGLRRGHMPGSINLPFNDLLDQTGCFKTKEAIQDVFEQAGVDLTRPIITSCGSGVTASILTLALTVLGVKNTKLYDGSWAEWGSRSDTVVISS